jgi:hypothetical protein
MKHIGTIQIITSNAVLEAFTWCWWRSFNETKGEGEKEKGKKISSEISSQREDDDAIHHPAD